MSHPPALSAEKYFRIFRPALSADDCRDGEAILAELYKQFPEASRNHHLRERILPVAALQRLLQQKGASKEEAVRRASEIYHQEQILPGARTFRKILRIPFLWKLFLPLLRKVLSRSYKSSDGFVMNFHKMNNEEARFDVLRCPYFEYCRQLGCPELTDAFCRADDLAYGQAHPKIVFERSGTIGRGQEKCDFYFYKR